MIKQIYMHNVSSITSSGIRIVKEQDYTTQITANSDNIKKVINGGYPLTMFGNTSGYLQLNLEYAAVLHKFYWTTWNRCQSVKIEGSNDNSTWTTLWTGGDGGQSSLLATLSTTGYYLYYKITLVKALSSGANIGTFAFM